MKRSEVVAVAWMTLMAACGDSAQLPVSAGIGAKPTLPAPHHTLIPTVNVANAVGWPSNATPKSTPGTVVGAFAKDLDHPRWLYVLPNGDVLVAETNAPPKPDDNKGLKGWFFKHFQKKAGAAVPGANRITLLRDANGDGVAERRWTLLRGMHSPFGMGFANGTLFVANTDAVVRVPYAVGDTSIAATPSTLVALPAGPLNHHWTKNLLLTPDGRRMYVTVGSNSKVAENGIDKEEGRAAIWEVDVATGAHRVYASGLRNPNGMAWEPRTGALWTSVNERDEIGSDLVPDFMTTLKEGGFYGWPYSYYGQHVDSRVSPSRPDMVARAIVPDYALGAHTASLGLASATGNSLPAEFADGMFVGQHGSWNRSPASGYKVIFVPFTNGHPAGPPRDVLTGFLDESGAARGRPVGVAIDATGALLVADDVGNTIWRVTAWRDQSQMRQEEPAAAPDE